MREIAAEYLLSTASLDEVGQLLIKQYERGRRAWWRSHLRGTNMTTNLDQVVLPGAFAFEYRSDEAGDVCWDCLLGLVREGVHIYLVPDLETDVGRTFPRTELGGLVLRVHLVDGVRVGYLCDMPPAPPSPIVEIIRCAEETPAETIKQRLIAFLHWPANSQGLWRDWGEVVDELLAGGDASTLETSPSPSPIPMLLACPACHVQHVDEGEWSTRLHRTHLCASCGATWRPALVHTVGVADLSTVAERIAAEVRSPATVDSSDRRRALRAEQVAGLKT